MLISEIERNLPTPPDKLVEKVASSHWSFPISRTEERAVQHRFRPARKGVVLRCSDRREGERRKNPLGAGDPHVGGQDRRKEESRKLLPPSDQGKRFDYIVIAVEHNASDPDPWNPGDEVLIHPIPAHSPEPSGTFPPAPESDRKSPNPDEDKDYVVTLSHTSPPA
ncbi:MAG: hypothetical protein COV67_03470 [Nitrospinae bacterium CG11_big_fil_rev_8_21_14_0_20_56_8]|nr:MAG: hypothetical protein COV67_03470 [Nitrospinae bacterium CG11_big_fil_rev_8_21_14_0_20_56_8]